MSAIQPDSPLVGRLHASPNCGPRRGVNAPDMLIMHYTGLDDCERAIDWLSRPESEVSSHYVIDEAGTITQMVAESARAWHAGVATWTNAKDINSHSIGIEIHNPGHTGGYPDFPQAQMAAVLALSQDILARHPIPARHVLGHSDVAPGRKIDPGEKFDWGWLAAGGVGLWVEPEPILASHAENDLTGTGPLVIDLQRKLATYGYGLGITGEYDERTRIVVQEFQRHFRPERVDGHCDHSTSATLDRLLSAARLQ